MPATALHVLCIASLQKQTRLLVALLLQNIGSKLGFGLAVAMVLTVESSSTSACKIASSVSVIILIINTPILRRNQGDLNLQNAFCS
jgi:hypothetical protein